MYKCCKRKKVMKHPLRHNNVHCIRFRQRVQSGANNGLILHYKRWKSVVYLCNAFFVDFEFHIFVFVDIFNFQLFKILFKLSIISLDIKHTFEVVYLKEYKHLLIFLDFNLFLKFDMVFLWCYPLKFDVCFILNDICKQYCTRIPCINNILFAIFSINFL